VKHFTYLNRENIIGYTALKYIYFNVPVTLVSYFYGHFNDERQVDFIPPSFSVPAEYVIHGRNTLFQIRYILGSDKSQ
jgi:hypothetical protein